MTEQLTMAAKNLKNIGTEITQWENRLEYVKGEVDKHTKTRDALLAEIDKKSSDFGVYMSLKDAEVKKGYTDLAAQREQLSKDQGEFQSLLRNHREEKNVLDAEKKDFETQKLKHAASMENIEQFITAVRRAIGLLGI